MLANIFWVGLWGPCGGHLSFEHYILTPSLSDTPCFLIGYLLKDKIGAEESNSSSYVVHRLASCLWVSSSSICLLLLVVTYFVRSM